jgi:hypothetical protein
MVDKRRIMELQIELDELRRKEEDKRRAADMERVKAVAITVGDMIDYLTQFSRERKILLAFEGGLAAVQLEHIFYNELEAHMLHLRHIDDLWGVETMRY